MLTDKQIKEEFKKKAWNNPNKYYAVDILKQEGFSRKICKFCKRPFWSTTDRDYCDDPEHSGGFRFFDKNPVKHKLNYIETWKEFARLFKKFGYTPIKRYPVVARWRDDTDFVQASIYDFQPFVVSGEVKPPANPLVVPQFCLRFNDIDNVGITGAHYTGFVMIGQHAFTPPDKFDQIKYFTDIHNWLRKGLGLPNEEITYHEDAWAGGGNFGPCMEFFSRGLELGNQVYMLYELTTNSYKELDIKVLDMGMGHERNAWFTKATNTSYETTFPTVIKNLFSKTGIKYNSGLIKRFLPYSSYLNMDEIQDVRKTWINISNKLKVDVKELKNNVLPLAALYSIAEHSRSLLVALNDGALPSNSGGGYNLRIILRRALDFIEKYNWNLDLANIAKLHAKYLKPLFPELMKNLDDVSEILDVEKKKYEQTKKRSRDILSKIIHSDINSEKLIQLYDSHGITPEIIKDEAGKINKIVKVPENFYAKVAEKHERKEQLHATKKEKKLNLKGITETNTLYYQDYLKDKFTGKVLAIIDNNVILDKTVFYPTSGGQLNDTGYLNDCEVIEVFKQGSVIIHRLKEKPKFKLGDVIKGKIDLERRRQLAQHHTLTHIINASAKKVLGNHINQAGAKKTTKKAHIDITHYKPLTEKELKAIETTANNVINKKIKIKLFFVDRNEGEKKFGTAIYQGGVVPGKKLRIVEIKGVDIECCGGTHLTNTGQVGKIKILRSTKISDSIIRIEYIAGKALEEESEKESGTLEEISKLLGANKNKLLGRAEELFNKWKLVVKKKKELNKKEIKLTSNRIDNLSDKELLEKVARVFKTQQEHIPKVARRFLKELNEYSK